MSSNRIDLLNLFLLVLSLAIAIVLPFETFFFAYAVFGPLHYLTEINWLNNRSFFTKNKSHIWILVLLAILISIPTLTYGLFVLSEKNLVHQLISPLRFVLSDIIFISFITSIGLVYIKNRKQLIPLLLFAIGVAYFTRTIPFYAVFIGVFLPTLVHVYIFTLAFMLQGIIRNKNIAGILTFSLAVFCPFIIFFLPWELSLGITDKSVISKYFGNDLKQINVTLAQFFTNEGTSPEKLLVSKTGIKIQTFIAFAYLYHYLNWFSKVSVIGWLKNTPPRKFILIGMAWIFSVILYYYDYQLGLTVLFFMSLLHVILEFPLNVICIRGILHQLKGFIFLRTRS